MNNKIKFQLSQAEIEYLADLLSYEIADPEPRMAFHLETEQVEELQNRLKKLSIEFDAYSPNPNEWIQNEDTRYQEDPENWVD